MGVPDAQAWAGYASDRDVRLLHRRFFGKPAEAMRASLAAGEGASCMEGLLFAPSAVFQYYIHAFVDYLLSPHASGDADTAAAFLVLLNARERCDPGSVRSIYPALAVCVEAVAASQERFDADSAAYGCFAQRAARIREACGLVRSCS